MEFNIFSKRVISLVVGNGLHWCSYSAIHLGEYLSQPLTSTRSGSGGKKCPRPFITVADSLGFHEKQSPEDLFVVFIFDVLLHLEKWITKVVGLKASIGEGAPLPKPDLINMASNCRDRAFMGTSIFNPNSFESHKKYYTQADSHNCGIFSIINVPAAYVSDAKYHLNWPEIRSPNDFFREVLKPYWQVCDGGKLQRKEVMIRIEHFCYNYILLAQRKAPSKHYKVATDPANGKYWLRLRNGNVVSGNDVEDML